MPKKKLDQKKYIQLYKEAFETEAGKVVLADLVDKFRLLRPFPIKADKDLLFCEGQRQVVLYILNIIGYDLSKLEELMSKYSTEVDNGRANTATSTATYT